MRKILPVLSIIVMLAGASPALAMVPAPTESVMFAVPRVICGNRQGSGVVTNAVDGYIITNGHIVIDDATKQAASDCQVSFVDGNGIPRSHYLATVEHAVLDQWRELDFAVLKLGGRIGGPAVVPTGLLVNEFAAVNMDVAVIGFPGGSQAVTNGSITGFSRGTVLSDAIIAEGSSGGAAVDLNHRLVGIATKIRFLIDPDTGKEQVVDYEMGDVLQLINWLDTFGPHEHGRYLSHADPDLYHGLPYLIRDESSGCQDLVRTTLSPTVYCLLTGGKRLVFPNNRTFFSWYPDFSEVFYAKLDDIARFQLVGNVTFKAGTLVKITTDPKVYMVSDSIGTLRWVPSEERAIQYFGPAWAAKVKDVPDEFFVNYSIGQPLP